MPKLRCETPSRRLPASPLKIPFQVHDGQSQRAYRIDSFRGDLGEPLKPEECNLLALTVRSQSWLWSTAMLGSSLVGYNYGIAGPFWFAAGCSPMIVFFALLGISCKLKVPEAHTLLEIVRIRYGTPTMKNPN